MATEQATETVSVDVPHARISRPSLDACATHNGEGRPVDRLALLALLTVHANARGIVAYSIRGWATSILGMSPKRYQRTLRDLLAIEALVPMDGRGSWRIPTYIYVNARDEEGHGYVPLDAQWSFLTLPTIIEAACSSRSQRTRQTATRNVAVWVALMMRRENERAHVSIDRLAEDLGVGRDAIIAALDDLEAAHVVQSETTHYVTQGADGLQHARRGSNRYTPLLTLTCQQAAARGYGWATTRDYTALKTRLYETPKTGGGPKSDFTDVQNPTFQTAKTRQRSRSEVFTSENSKENTSADAEAADSVAEEVELGEEQNPPATEEDQQMSTHRSVAGQGTSDEKLRTKSPSIRTKERTYPPIILAVNAQVESAEVEVEVIYAGHDDTDDDAAEAVEADVPLPAHPIDDVEQQRITSIGIAERYEHWRLSKGLGHLQTRSWRGVIISRTRQALTEGISPAIAMQAVWTWHDRAVETAATSGQPLHPGAIITIARHAARPDTKKHNPDANDDRRSRGDALARLRDEFAA